MGSTRQMQYTGRMSVVTLFRRERIDEFIAEGEQCGNALLVAPIVEKSPGVDTPYITDAYLAETEREGRVISDLRAFSAKHCTDIAALLSLAYRTGREDEVAYSLNTHDDRCDIELFTTWPGLMRTGKVGHIALLDGEGWAPIEQATPFADPLVFQRTSEAGHLLLRGVGIIYPNDILVPVQVVGELPVL
jgi:hypothetical protein